MKSCVCSSPILARCASIRPRRSLTSPSKRVAASDKSTGADKAPAAGDACAAAFAASMRFASQPARPSISFWRFVVSWVRELSRDEIAARFVCSAELSTTRRAARASRWACWCSRSVCACTSRAPRELAARLFDHSAANRFTSRRTALTASAASASISARPRPICFASRSPAVWSAEHSFVAVSSASSPIRRSLRPRVDPSWAAARLKATCRRCAARVAFWLAASNERSRSLTIVTCDRRRDAASGKGYSALRGALKRGLVLRGPQRSSEVLKGPQRSSEVLRGPQRSSEVLRGPQRSSEVIRGHQRSSEAL